MTLLLALIALPGIAAVLLRWSAAMFATARHSIERFAAGQIVDQRARRGDISGMAAAERIRQASRHQQWRSVLKVTLWTVALLVPLALPGTFILYALYGLLWFLPKRSAGELL